MSKTLATAVASSPPKPLGLQEKFQAAFRDLLPLAIGLAIVLIAVKGALLPFNVSTIGEFVRWTLRLAIVCSADVAFVTLLTLCCSFVHVAAAPWTWARRTWRPVMFLSFYAAGVFEIFSYGIYHVTLQPFSIRMLTLVGEGGGIMRSSVEPYLTAPMLTALVLGPLVPLLFSLILRWRPLAKRVSMLGMRAAVIATGLVLVYSAVCRGYVESQWNQPRRWERRISANPHMEFFTSCVEEFSKTESFTLVYHSNDADMRDFVSRERPDGAKRTVNLPNWELAGPRPKNVVVFFLESISSEYLSLYGNKHPTTPHLDKLVAEKGIAFESFYVATPYSCKSIIAQTASVYPRIDWKLIVSNPDPFDVPIISQVLKENGFRTCYAHSGYFSWRGRDKYIRPRGCDMLIDAQNLPEEHLSSWGVSDMVMLQSSLDWIDAEPEKPFFAFLYTLETHHPYATPAKPYNFGLDDPEKEKYFNGIRATDERIAWYMDELSKRGMLDDTLIVILGDNGECFGQHNQRCHNFGIYQCDVNVPLIMFHPSLMNQERRPKGPREQIDVSPTILDILGIPSPTEWQGRNAFRPDDDRPAYFFSIGNYVALGLRQGDWKYHYYLNEGTEELFDLSNDPEEANNVAKKFPERCSDYRRRVAGWVKYQRGFLARHGAK